MEVAAGDGFVVIGENDGVVGNRIYLAGYRIIHIFYCIAACAVNLWRAAERICVLYLAGYRVMSKIASLQQSS